MHQLCNRRAHRAQGAGSPQCPVRDAWRVLQACAMVLGCLPALPVGAQDTQAENDFPGIEQLMNESDLQATGVHRLTEAERSALTAWLLRYTAGEAELLQQTSRAVREEARNTRVEARLSDDFSGWSGKTVFRLDNGQIWRQRLPGRFRYRGDARDIVIEANALGLYRMTHVESGRSVGVTLIR